MNEAFFFSTELILKWIQPPSFAIPHCPVVEMLHCSSHFSTPGKSTSYPPSQCELTLYPSGLLWTIFASSVSFVVLFLQCTLSFDSIAKVIILCLSFIGSLSTFLLSGPPQGRIIQSLEVTSQTVEMSAPHLLNKINKYKIHTLTVGVKLHFLTGFKLLTVCCKKLKQDCALYHCFT